jgi:hypothetical protein
MIRQVYIGRYRVESDDVTFLQAAGDLKQRGIGYAD